MSKTTFEGRTATLTDGTTFDIPDTVSMDDTTSTRALAVALRDAGRTNAQVGALMGTTPGSAGNNITNGLRDLGRESEITSTGNGGGGSSSRSSVSASPVEVARQSLERAREAKANLGDAVRKADTERKALTADIKRLKLNTSEREDRSPVEALVAREHDRLDAKVKNARENVKTREAELDGIIAQWEGAISALEAIPS